MKLFGLGKRASTRKLAPDFNLTTLAARYRSDKGSTGSLPHNYTLLYDMLLGPRRDSVTRMLEIGLLVGGPEVGADADRATGDLPSVRMWLDYFPKAIVHGFDISDFSFFTHPRFRFTRGDSGIAADLQAVAARGERFDFIIDDGIARLLPPATGIPDAVPASGTRRHLYHRGSALAVAGL
ncbi:hypothetical protein [Sphingomonas sp. SRS2]|uniref:hypothetical protein n=1 Tax=Sphingomonas sp. SRS2 TaxID=133190 RepID=UPI000698F93C|nr:hypothetical protein [Sphingomonas sp. SRS2]